MANAGRWQKFVSIRHVALLVTAALELFLMNTDYPLFDSPTVLNRIMNLPPKSSFVDSHLRISAVGDVRV